MLRATALPIGLRFALVLCALTFPPARATSQDSPASPAAISVTTEDRARLERFVALWESQQTEIASCEITYRYFHSDLAAKPSREELESALRAHDLTAGPDAMRQFITALNGAPFRVDPPWVEASLVFEGRKRRNNQGVFQFVDDGELAIHRDGLNRQFNVYESGRGQLSSDSLDDLRMLPDVPLRAEEFVVVGRSDDGVRVRPLYHDENGATSVSLREYRVDEATGVILGLSVTYENGQPYREVRFLGLTELPGGIAFPRASVHAAFHEGKLVILTIRAIDSIRFNEPVAGAAFVMPAEKTNVVVDYRQDEFAFPLAQDTSDLFVTMRERAAPPRHAPARSRGLGHRLPLLVLNGLFLIVVGALIWRRSRQPSPSETPPRSPLAKRDPA